MEAVPLEILLYLGEVGTEAHNKTLFSDVVVDEDAVFSEIALDGHGACSEVIDCFIRFVRPSWAK